MKTHSLEYIRELSRIRDEGGILWFIERTDTNKFLRLSLGFFDGGAHSERNTDMVNWDDVVGAFPMTHAYLTKEDAEKNIPTEMTEGGCRHCGHKSKAIPMIVTEHEFVPDAPKNKCIVCEVDTDNEVWCDMHTPLV